MSKLGLVVILLSACATTATTSGRFDREPTARARVELDLATGPDHRAVFPTAIAPRLPTVDRMHRDIRARLGAEIVATIDLCVAPDGHVTKVVLARGTKLAAFDDALVRDAAHWRFTTLPGPASLQTCDRATVKYVAPDNS